MPDVAVHSAVIYAPIAMLGHYRGVVVAVRGRDVVDIELKKEETGVGETLHLQAIPVVPTLKELAPGTCCLDTA